MVNKLRLLTLKKEKYLPRDPCGGYSRNSLKKNGNTYVPKLNNNSGKKKQRSSKKCLSKARLFTIAPTQKKKRLMLRTIAILFKNYAINTVKLQWKNSSATIFTDGFLS